MEKTLKLCTFVDGVNDTPFPNKVNNVDYGQIEIGTFRYDATRMGGAPTITATVMHELCLDDIWNENVYAEFNGEKYFLRQTPTSSYSEEDTRYKHQITLVSERVILDNVYFYDAVTGEPQQGDKPVSHSAVVVFFGDIHEFVRRMNASLQYAKLQTEDASGNITGYNIVVDTDIESEEKLMSFSNQFFSNVLQEIYNTYELPYYFNGKTIHIGFTDNVIPNVFHYGIDDALLSIEKSNANNKTVNKVTGIGSTENIPFYYPNDTPKACIAVSQTEGLTANVIDGEALEANTKIGDILVFKGNAPFDLNKKDYIECSSSLFNNAPFVPTKKLFESFPIPMTFSVGIEVKEIKLYNDDGTIYGDSTGSVLFRIGYKEKNNSKAPARILKEYVSLGLGQQGNLSINFNGDATLANTNCIFYMEVQRGTVGNYSTKKVGVKADLTFESQWYNQRTNICYTSSQLGIATNREPQFGDKIVIEQGGYINPQTNLMPPIYRESLGDERFYRALNDTYTNPDTGDKYEFENPYVDGHPVEQIVEFPEIKPTIKGARNSMDEPIDEFIEYAFDYDDNNEVDENGEYIHSFFFAKLHKLPFNLFDHSIENGEMTINMTGGTLGGCSFVVAVSDDDSNGKQWNTVQVDENGDLVRDEFGNVLCGIESQGDVYAQEEQNDTINNEVWIALKKDQDYTTYARPTLEAKLTESGLNISDAGGTPIPNKKGHYTPSEGTKFVITNILLPKSYILDAENRLREAIIAYMAENNAEKFNFRIRFSRIYFEENLNVLSELNENSRIYIEYNGKQYLLYVSSYSYSMDADFALPEISVDLKDTLSTNKVGLQNTISQVKTDLLSTIRSVDVLGIGSQYFIRKDREDTAKKKIIFQEGFEVGNYSEGILGSGAKMGIDDTGASFAEVDFLNVRRKATFTEISVQEIRSAGGVILVTPASLICSSVVEEDEYYRCYFSTYDNEGKFIFNEFEVGDQARCQTFNLLGTRYYWRLVVGVGDNYIDLSKTDCDTGSDIPVVGDKIIQLGHRTNIERQNAIVIAAYGTGSPYIIQYKGINSYDLSDKKIVTKLSSTENIFTGKVHMELGSDGLNNLSGLPEFLKDAIGDIEVGGQNLLRNSGFTGDYLSEQLADGSVLEATDQMFNPPLVHWGAVNATVQDSTESASKKEVVLANGGLTQTLYYDVIANETYILSFKAKGTSLTYSLGGVTKDIALTENWVKYIETIETTQSGTIFSITGATCVLCEIQLERGTIATAWSNSPFDNSSDRAYYESLKYLNQSLNNGSTDILSGLVLTNHIKVGNYANKVMIAETGGMNGSYVDNNSPAFWAGGTMDLALSTIKKYATSTTTPAGEIPYAVSHGGKVILNDAIVRGTIYANDGIFNGTVNAKSGIFNGIEIESGKIAGFEITKNRLGTTAESNNAEFEWFASGEKFLRISGQNTGGLLSCRNDGGRVANFESYGNGGCALRLLGNTGAEALTSHGNVLLEARSGEQVTIKGMGLRFRSVDNGAVLNNNDDIVVASGGVRLPTSCTQGKIMIIQNDSSGDIQVSNSDNGRWRAFTVASKTGIIVFYDGTKWHSPNASNV